MAFLGEYGDKLGKAFGWGVLVVSAVFAADLSASALERTLMKPPAEMEVAEVASTATTASREISDCSSLLRAPDIDPEEEVQQSQEEKSSDDDSQGTVAKRRAKVTLDGVTLLGTMMGNGAQAAIVSDGTDTFVVSVGDTFKDLILVSVANSWAYFAPDDGRRGVRLMLDTVSGFGLEEEPEEEPEEVKDASKDGDKDGDKDGAKDKPIVKERLSLDDIRAILNDTTKIASQVRVVPQSKDDQPYGTKLVFRTPDNVMAQMGLQNDDILLSVNGSPCRSVEDMYQGYMTIRNAESLEFVIDRNGEQKTIRYDLAK